MKEKWREAQEWERTWWGDCANTYNEEAKQYGYAAKMGLAPFASNWYGRRGWDFGGQAVLDVGGGPCSLLLKATARKRVVVDPCNFPPWVEARYGDCGVEYLKAPAEKMKFDDVFDLALCYNVLQHVADPKKVIARMRRYSKEIRLFEWIGTGTSDGHLHDLEPNQLNEWLGGYGKVEKLSSPPLVGKAYYGIFPV